MILSRQNINAKVSNVTMYDYEQTYNTCTTIDSQIGTTTTRDLVTSCWGGGSSSGSSSSSKNSGIEYFDDGTHRGYRRKSN